MTDAILVLAVVYLCTAVPFFTLTAYFSIKKARKDYENF